MPQDSPAKATSNLFADLVQTPAGQAVARRVEPGGALAFSGMAPSAQPFFAALLQQIFPQRPIVVVTENLKTQESFQQDLETWLNEMRSAEGGVRNEAAAPSAILHPPSSPLFYPAWETLPHEDKLPHADVISDRLQTLVALADNSKPKTQYSKLLVVTSVTALLQKTFPPGEIQNRTRSLIRGDKIAPLDLVEFLEAQGYEPEAQVSQKGELALRGGIVDVFPPTSPWPVRLEFFGDELESLRYFDPLTQISREEVSRVTLPPAGELGILKRPAGILPADQTKNGAAGGTPTARCSLATLLDYLPRETIFLLCGPESLAVHAAAYEQQVPQADSFFISWPDFLAELHRRGFTSAELADDESPTETGWGEAPDEPALEDDRSLKSAAREDARPTGPVFSSLDAFRPLAERAPEPPIAEAQRREFFQQLHRWLRQDYAVHVFCNNDGERQRFKEIWGELVEQASSLSSSSGIAGKLSNELDRQDACPTLHLGSLARGFICDDAKLVVVTDAEIFGRYKIQRPRRQKSAHAQAARSALDID
ncbi:MAG TPA: transcription-repair coupling factor, partial [Verrucomicrobiae bacterium]